MSMLQRKKSEKESRVRNLPSEMPRCLEPDHHADFRPLRVRHLLQRTTAHNRQQKTTFVSQFITVVSEIQSRFEGNDQEVLSALGEIVFSCSPSHNNIQTVSNFYGVDCEMLSSEKSIFENYDCGDPCQRKKNAAVMEKSMHQNGLHDILPVLYKVASILATIPATSCSAERSFSALRRIKTSLRSTMGQDRLSSIAVINIERKYANKTMQDENYCNASYCK